LHMSQSPAATAPQGPPILPPFSTMSPTIKQQQFSPVQPFFIPAYIQSPVQPLSPPTPQMRFVPFNPQIHAHASQSPPAYSPPTYAATQPRPDLKIAIADVLPPPPVSVSVPQPTPPPRESMFKDLAVTMSDAKTRPLLPRELTFTSVEDIDRAFEPYERMMQDLLLKARSGAFAPIGLDPTLVVPVNDSDTSDDEDMDTSP